MSNEELIEKIEWSIQVNEFAKAIDGDCAHINIEVLKEILAKLKKESELKEIEFSKDGEGKVLLGIMCRKTEDGKYQKILNLEDIGDNDCKIGDKIHRNQAGKSIVDLVFNKDESIDAVINKLQKLKKLNAEETIRIQKEIEYSECTNQLPLGC